MVFTNRKFRKARLSAIYWEWEENGPARLNDDCGSGRRNKASKLKMDWIDWKGL